MTAKSNVGALVCTLALGLGALAGAAYAGSSSAASPMQATGESPQCIAAYRNAGNDGTPPASSAGAVIQMQYVLYLYDEQIRAVRENCQGWQLQAQSVRELQAAYDQTMAVCRQVATNPADCRPVARPT